MLRHFTHRTEIAAPVDEAFAWHERPGAFERLAPPWETMTVEHASGGIKDGGKLTFAMKVGPIWQRWSAEHFGYQQNRQFCDRQAAGPFAQWEHTHGFSAKGDGGTVIEDRVSYRLPAEPFSNLAPRCLVEDKLESSFAWRAFTVKHDIEFHHRLGMAPKRVLVTGSSGMVGGQLVPFLTSGGHSVVRLLRGSKRGGPGTLSWNPKAGFDAGELAALEGIDAVVNLAGENIMGVWTDEKKRRLRDSRVPYTRLLCEGLAKLQRKPTVLVSASASGIYGNREDEELTEESLTGVGFLADLSREWEEATRPAVEAGIRVVNLRIGVVLDPRGGALKVARMPFLFGLGGKLGTGRQWMSWIALDDLISMIVFAIGTPSVSGPLNACAPRPVTNAEFTKELAKAVHRPAAFPVPAFAVRRVTGDLANVFLGSIRMAPRKALAAGFQFRFPQLPTALPMLLGKNPQKEG